MKHVGIRFFLGLCLASFIFGALTLSSAMPSAYAQSGSDVAVAYSDGTTAGYSYGDCIPLKKPGGFTAKTISVNVTARAELFDDLSCQDFAGIQQLKSDSNDATALPNWPFGSIIVLPNCGR